MWAVSGGGKLVASSRQRSVAADRALACVDSARSGTRFSTIRLCLMLVEESVPSDRVSPLGLHRRQLR